MRRKIPPTVMDASARLKDGQWAVDRWKSRKSTTDPVRIRSLKLPSAPPRMRDKANVIRRLCRIVRKRR